MTARANPTEPPLVAELKQMRLPNIRRAERRAPAARGEDAASRERSYTTQRDATVAELVEQHKRAFTHCLAESAPRQARATRRPWRGTWPCVSTRP